MKRRDFIVDGCTVCLAATGLAALISSCKPTQIVNGNMNKDGLLVDLNDFKVKGNNKEDYHSYLVIRNEALKFPICVYRFNGRDYTAIWMQCAHQGAELQVSGSYLHCPAHGSEYNNKGIVTTGPAERNLKTFPVTVNNNQLFIDLRKS